MARTPIALLAGVAAYLAAYATGRTIVFAHVASRVTDRLPSRHAGEGRSSALHPGLTLPVAHDGLSHPSKSDVGCPDSPGRDPLNPLTRCYGPDRNPCASRSVLTTAYLPCLLSVELMCSGPDALGLTRSRSVLSLQPEHYSVYDMLQALNGQMTSH